MNRLSDISSAICNVSLLLLGVLLVDTETVGFVELFAGEHVVDDVDGELKSDCLVLLNEMDSLSISTFSLL